MELFGYLGEQGLETSPNRLGLPAVEVPEIGLPRVGCGADCTHLMSVDLGFAPADGAK
jgi:hypothetical protein